MLTSPSERERHHSASSERCPTNAKAVIMTIQHRCRRALIWCQSNLQANYVGFIIIYFFFSISAPLDLLLTFPCCQSPWNHLFEEIENHRCTPHPHPRVFSAVFGIYIHIYIFLLLKFRAYTFEFIPEVSSKGPIQRCLTERSVKMVLVALGWADRRRRDKRAGPDYD